MASALLTKNLWAKLRKLGTANNGPAYVAVPFVGSGAAKRLRLRRGDTLITRFDEAAIRVGLVDPREIVRFINRGVEVHAVSNLHAKVYVRGHTAIVTSANLSGHSENALVEAGVAVSDASTVAACRAFVRSLRGDIVELEFARRQVTKYRPPRNPTPRRRRALKREKVIRHSGILAVVLDSIDYDELDERALSVAEEAAERRLRDRDLFHLDSFRWDGSLPRALRVGQRVLRINRNGNRVRTVSAPARVLAFRRYRGSKGAARAMVVIEVRKYLRDKSLSSVIRKIGSGAKLLRDVQGQREIHNADLVYRLGQVWPRVA
jgi:hypothetical protein